MIRLKKIGWQYAFGELFLIVIGVLSAIALNNWWQNKQDARLEQEYKLRMIAELKADTAEISRLMFYYGGTIDGILELQDSLYDPEYSLAQLHDNAKLWMRYSRNIMPNKGAYTELLSTGKFDLLRDDVLKDKIINLYDNQYEETLHYISTRLEALLEVRIAFITRELDWSALFRNSFSDIDATANLQALFKDVPSLELDDDWFRDKKSKRFQYLVNLLSFKLAIYNGLMTRFENLKEACEDLIISLDATIVDA